MLPYYHLSKHKIPAIIQRTEPINYTVAITGLLSTVRENAIIEYKKATIKSKIAIFYSPQ